jgi:predicted nucleic acid-binding protein
MSGTHHNTPDPTRIVADADVLATDLLVGGEARQALDVIWEHSWLTLVASDPLLDATEATIGSLADGSLAAHWRERLEEWRCRVDQEPGDHPGLASAYRGNAAHLLSFDERLTSVTGGANLRKHLAVSVRSPKAFVAIFSAEQVWPEVNNTEYPGPDRDSRAESV